MLSRVSQDIRSLFGGEQTETKGDKTKSRKRHIDSWADDDISGTPTKRSRQDNGQDESGQFKTPLPRMSHIERQHMVRVPQRVQDYRTPVSRHNGGYHGGVPRSSYQPMYDKTFRAQNSSRQNSSRRNSRGTLTAKESIRLDEKSRYAQLLQQFTTIPVAGATTYGSSFIKKPVSHAASSVNESLLGSTMELPRQSSSLRSPRLSHSGVEPVKEVDVTI